MDPVPIDERVVPSQGASAADDPVRQNDPVDHSWADAYESSIQAFVDHAWEVMRWHRQRAEAWDRLAMQVVAFSGLIVAVIGANIKFLEDILDNQHRRLVMVGLTATLAVLVVACLVSLLSLMGRLRTAQSKTEEIQERWGEFSEDPRANRAELLAMVADSLIGKPGGPSTAIIEIRDAADRREFRTRTAAALLCVGVLVMAAALFGVLAWR